MRMSIQPLTIPTVSTCKGIEQSATAPRAVFRACSAKKAAKEGP